VNLSLSAGGQPAFTKETLRSQIDSQLGTAPAAEKAAVAGAVMQYIDAQIADVPSDGSVSVSVSLWISVAKPTPVS
jgi:hypothetical protein